MIGSDDELSASCRTSSAAGCGSNTPSMTTYAFRSKKYKSDNATFSVAKLTKIPMSPSPRSRAVCFPDFVPDRRPYQGFSDIGHECAQPFSSFLSVTNLTYLGERLVFVPDLEPQRYMIDTSWKL